MKLFNAPSPSTLPPLLYGLPEFLSIYLALGSFIILSLFILPGLLLLFLIMANMGIRKPSTNFASNDKSLLFISYELTPN